MEIGDSPASQAGELKVVTKQGGREPQTAGNNISWRRASTDILITDSN